MDLKQENIMLTTPDLYLSPRKKILTVNIDRVLTPSVMILGLSDGKIEVLSVDLGQKMNPNNSVKNV